MKNEALNAELKHKTAVESAYDYIENFDILETITNVGNDEVFTPRKTCDMMLDILPKEVWSNPNYKWLNPATKNGIFEREIALRLDKGLEKKIPNKAKRRKHILQNMIYSIGLTKFTANVARRTLYYCSEANRKCDGIVAEDGHYVNGYAIGNGTWFDDAEGNIKTPNTDHCFEEKDKHCKFCGIKDDSKYLDANQIEKYAYEFIHVPADKLDEYIARRFFKGDKKMKFDVVIGNPPYQLSFGIEGKNSSNAKSIYNLFIEQAMRLKPKYISMIVKSTWMTRTAQGVSDEWIDNMISDTRFKTIHDFSDGQECFPTLSLNGGVNYFLWDRDYNGPCKYVFHDNGKIFERNGYLDELNAGVIVRDPKDLKLIEKISKIEGKYFKDEIKNFSGLVSPKHFFDKDNLLTSNWKEYKLEQDTVHNIKYYVSQSFNEKPFGWISEKQLPKNKGTKDINKVYIPAANGSVDWVLGKPFYGEPNSVCSQTYLIIGYDPAKHNFSKEQCENIISYIKTKFFRYLVSIKKKTQNGPRGVYQFVPLQDFNQQWTDEKLYKKYNLSNDEINVIESLIKPMD